ncbi:low-complexity tail membrane protein [Aerosakkonemataceae cyanobacterium BLCC-F154]|uniref:Low-complexity tail membrane protein n=1 Tax=Floridaenema fluviatile BLCC-F154 TaxID=3153640 RepID=A0ABV4YDK9_9CYAN
MIPSFWSEPFLWIHLAGIAAFPIWLGILLLSLAVGDPLLPVWVEFSLVAVIGVAPILWMQLVKPFNIFCILVVALKPEALTVEQRKILSLFKRPLEKVGAIVAPLFLLGVLWQIYSLAPVAEGFSPLTSSWRIVALLVAGVAFLLSNLFFQIPLSVVGVLLTKESTFATTEPYPVEKIPDDFTIAGFQVDKILPLKSSPKTLSQEPNSSTIEDSKSTSST